MIKMSYLTNSNYLRSGFPTTGFSLLTDTNVFAPVSLPLPPLVSPDTILSLVASNSTGTILYVLTYLPDASGAQYTLYRSTDLGQSYTNPNATGLYPTLDITDNTSILSISEDGMVLLLTVTTYYNFNYTYYSNDGGNTFTAIPVSNNYGGLVSPNGTANYIQQEIGNGSLWTWNGVSLNSLYSDASDVQYISTSYDGTHVLATSYTNQSYVLYSSDSGQSWSKQTLTSPSDHYLVGSAMAWDASVYYTALIDNSDGGSMLGTARSWDQGETWEFFENNGLNLSYNDQNLYTSPDGRYVYAMDGSNNLFVSVNYAETFQNFPFGFSQYDISVISDRSVLGTDNDQILLYTIYQYLLYLSSTYGNCYLTY